MPRSELSIKKDNTNNRLDETARCKIIHPTLTSKPPLLKRDQSTRWGNAGAYSMFYVNHQAKIHHKIKKQKEFEKMRAKYCSMPQTTVKVFVTRPTKPLPLGPIAVPIFSSYGWGPMG